MWFESFTDEDVHDWIDDCAQRMIDDYDDDVDETTRLQEVVENYTCYAADAIKLVAYYDVFDVIAGCDFDDSPIARFENDVFEAYLALKGEE